MFVLFRCFVCCGLVVIGSMKTAAAAALPTRFHFLPLKPDTSVVVKAEGTPTSRPERWMARMVVDGVLTDGRWPEHPPTAYALSKEAFFLDDNYSGAGDFIWDRSTKKLTQIGRCYLHAVPGLGMMVLRRPSFEPPVVEILDFPVASGEPRVLWRKEHSYLAPLGEWDGALVCALSEKRLLVLEPAWAPKEIDFDLGKHRWQATGEAIRRGKALVLGELPHGPRELNPFYMVSVAVVNLKTREVKPLGEIPGGWTLDTAVLHPVAAARWISEKQLTTQLTTPPQLAAAPHALVSGGASYVIEETDQIVRRAKKKP
jgi:hypothetical protein